MIREGREFSSNRRGGRGGAGEARAGPLGHPPGTPTSRPEVSTVRPDGLRSPAGLPPDGAAIPCGQSGY